MAASTVPANSLSPSVQNSSSPCLDWSAVLQPKCKCPIQVCQRSSLENEKTLIKCGKKIKRKCVSSPNDCSMTQKKKKKKEEEEDKFESEDQSKELVSCNEEDKKNIKKIKSFKILIKVPATEKKTAEEDEKQIANLVEEKPAARTQNIRPRRKTNSKYASSAVEDEPEFISSLNIKEIEEDYFYLFGKPLRRTRKRVR